MTETKPKPQNRDDRFTYATEPQTPQCLHCKRYRNDLTCDAFQGGIPIGIFDGDFNHAEEFEGDNGIRFEQDPDLPKWEA